MLALVQRVAEARVEVDAVVVASIGCGLLAFVCIEPGDDDALADRMARKLLALRIFGDAAGKMNRSVVDVDGAALLVSQFTLAADTRAGNRPSFTGAAEPVLGRRLFERVALQMRARHAHIAEGIFGADMRVALVNDGPVTLMLRL